MLKKIGSKPGQDEKSKILSIVSKKAQEELIGFGIIVVIVFVILLVFISIYVRRPQENSQNYEIESFISATLDYTSSCEETRKGFLSVKDLIFECYDNETCVGGKSSCEVLGTTVEGISKESWLLTENSETKGYVINVTGNGRNLASLSKGNKTSNSKGYQESLFKSGISVKVLFTIYG